MKAVELHPADYRPAPPEDTPYGIGFIGCGSIAQTAHLPAYRSCGYTVAAVCDILGRVARVTGKVRRGLGAARQDVNVSITGGCRVEIKGVCRIAAIPKLVHNEALRQARLLAIRDHLLELGFDRGVVIGVRGIAVVG